MKTATKTDNFIRLNAFSLLTIFIFICYTFFYEPILSKEELLCPIQAPGVKPVDLLLSTRDRLERGFRNFNITSTSILLPSSGAVLRDESDTELPGWRQTSNIYYILGKFSMPDVFLLINVNENGALSYYLLLPNYNTREIVFSAGNVPNKTELLERYVLDGVYQIEELSNLLGTDSLVTPSKGWDKKSFPGCGNVSITLEYSSSIEQVFLESRFIKTELELEMLSYSSKIASYSHYYIKNSIKNFAAASESKLASLFTHVSSICLCELQAYNPIVGAAKHGAVLHFPTGQSFDDGMSLIAPRDFILIDAAPAYRGYASDLTRTYAKKESLEFIALSQIVLDAQMAGIAAYKLGNRWSKVVDATLNKLTEGLWNSGFLISSTLQPLIDSGVISIFMPHGVGHPVGLDVHDPYPDSVSTAKTGNVQSAASLRDEYPLKLANDYLLAQGMVHTIEPGVYFIEYLLNMGKNESMGVSHFINWTAVDLWRGRGGVRIEDVVAIMYDGSSKILTQH